VGFWRWCLWKLFESEGAPKRGVVCLITNRTFLAGHPYAGLRQMLRRRFNAIDIIDLRGDLRGARPAGIARDEGVFAIQTGVCVLIATAQGGAREPGARARVRYADAWRHGAFDEAAKLALVARAEADPATITFVEILGGDLDDFVPKGFGGLDWPSLSECFLFMKSGVKTQRDQLVYGHSESAIATQIAGFTGADQLAAWVEFFPASNAEAGLRILASEARHLTTTDRGLSRRFARARGVVYEKGHLVRRIYRPLDRRWLYANSEYVSRHGPELLAAWGAENRCLYAMPAGTGAGPAAWVHALVPDYHAFRGSYGGYAFPLWDRRQGAEAHNLTPALLSGLAAAYGSPVAPVAVFDAIAALLSAASYTQRFAWDLEEAFPHIPFPANPATFAEAARIGAEIRALQGFERAPGEAFRKARLAGKAGGLLLEVPAPASAFLPQPDGTGRIPLQADGSLRLEGVAPAIWSFAVSGYRVLYRWLKAREGEALADVQRDACDIAWRIEELLHWFAAADAALEDAIARPLTRAALGLPPPPAPGRDAVEGQDDPPDSPG
jgi:predicted helicase